MLDHLVRLLHHSELGESDGVLLGASKLEHLEKNLECAKVAKPLSENIRVAFDKAWELTQADGKILAVIFEADSRKI